MIATQKMKSFPQSNLCIGKAFQAHLVKLILSTQLICFIKSDLCANEINPNHFGCVCFYVRILRGVALMKKCGVRQSFSALGRPHDNAIAESFFASFKKEEAYRREYTSEQSFRKSVEQYVMFYNTSRPHQTLNYQTPQAFEEAYRERL